MATNSMDEVVPNLWIGDIASATDIETLIANNIHSILSAMRGKVSIRPGFVQHQVLLDDTEDTDALAHFPASIAFIETELDKGRGVLVHCHAGMSRSATIVAAYLMYSRNLDASAALELIRTVRPNVQPNDGFLMQLEVFYSAAYKISRREKATRMFYLQRAVEEILNGDGSAVETDMFAKYPRTPSDSAPATPGGPRRRIRCKMCRQELATREHLMDHGQSGPSTPLSVAASSPVVSRRPSMNESNPLLQRSTLTDPRVPSRRPSVKETRSRLPSFPSDTHPRRSSLLATEKPLIARDLPDSLTMSALDTDDDPEEEPPPEAFTRMASNGDPSKKSSGLAFERPMAPRGMLESLSMSALDTEDGPDPLPLQRSRSGSATQPRKSSLLAKEKPLFAQGLSNQLPMSTISSDSDGKQEEQSSGESKGASRATRPSLNGHVLTGLLSPADLAAQLNANPKLAALRSPSIVKTPLSPNAQAYFTPLLPMTKISTPSSPPILANPKCSGYFIEPMKWMEPFLQDGQMAGKITCPNKKCGAKLGNYDWAGVNCSCKEWVTPGFCIHRSKVDEVI